MIKITPGEFRSLQIQLSSSEVETKLPKTISFDRKSTRKPFAKFKETKYRPRKIRNIGNKKAQPHKKGNLVKQIKEKKTSN